MNRIISSSSFQEKKEKNNKRLKCDLCKGLSKADAANSLELYGNNSFSKREKTTFFQKLLMNLNDPIIRILIAAMLINILFMFSDINWLETVGIGVTILVSSLVATISEHSGGAAFEKLYGQLNNIKHTVIREGRECSIPIDDIVCGDLVKLFPGEIVPADGFIIRGACTVDQSPLTGESRNIKKSINTSINKKLQHGLIAFNDTPTTGGTNVVFRGSSIVSGESIMLVERVGDSTFYGAVAAELQTEEGISPLKQRLTSLAQTISKMGYAAALIIALIHLFDAFILDSGMNLAIAAERIKDLRFVASECLSAVTMAISVIVVAVPEGLPMMITVVLSSNMKKMMKSNVLVKRPVGIETAGALSILFTDKTGTLTTGKMKVEEIHTAEAVYHTADELKNVSFDYKMILSGVETCSSEKGNSTDLAIQDLFKREVINYSTECDKIPFDSQQKYAAAVIDGEHFLIRGAPEYLFPQCKTFFSKTGEMLPLYEDERSRLSAKMILPAKQSGRVILQAVGQKSDFQKLKGKGLSAVQLTFHAIIVLSDEIREGIPDAVQACRKAGIKVVMLTGDNEITAASIGAKSGILSPKHTFFDALHPIETYQKQKPELVLTGAQLKELEDRDLLKILPQISIIARVTPTDKSRLVKLSKSAGHVVGMTGDGINDAPALKTADVGFAMGSGTEVAKEAADIVITDDNFVSITKAVLFGRTIFESIRKFIVFQLTMNLSAVGVSLLGPLFGIDHPVTVIQMLWVNIIMDTLGALAFAGEPALTEYMNRAPIPRSAPILTASMGRQIVFSGIYTIGLCILFLTSPGFHGIFGCMETSYFLTVFFALFIFCGIFTAFNTRTNKINILSNLRKNKAFLLIMPTVAFVQLLIIYFGGEAFRTVPIDFKELCLTAALSFTVIPMDMIRKLLSKTLSGQGRH